MTLSHLLDFSGQSVLITGASRGIGKAMAMLFHQAGANVAVLARSADALGQVAAELRAGEGKGEVTIAVCDVAVEQQVNDAVAHTHRTLGSVEVLVNNAGLISMGPLDQIDPAEWHRVIEANLTGAYLCSRAVAPIMQAAKRGRIINISSVSAQTGGVSGGVHYSASKGGMLALTKSLARDLAEDGINVNSIAPGQIDADPELLSPEALEKVTAMIPLGRLGTPEEIGFAVLFFASPMADFVTGATLDVNGGILKR